jgi:hypothetical protein
MTIVSSLSFHEVETVQKVLRAQQVLEKERPLFRMPQQFCMLQNHLLFSNNNKLKGFYVILAL